MTLLGDLLGSWSVYRAEGVILLVCYVTKNALVKKKFTGAPPVHRWCGEIVKYLMLVPLIT